MGSAKDALKIGEQTYLQRIERTLATECTPIILSTRMRQGLQQIPDGAVLVADRIQGVGPLGGLEASLREASRHRKFAVVIGCDYPLIEPALPRLLLSKMGDRDAVIPEVGGRLHPLAACYRTSLADVVSGFLTARSSRVLDFVATLRVQIISEAEVTESGCSSRSLTNVNTLAEHLAIPSSKTD